MSRQRWSLRSENSAPGQTGFTLVEILLALAVVALVAALVLPGINELLRTIDNAEPDQILWDAVTAAREQALTTNRPVWLRFDREKKLLGWTDGTAARTKSWPAAATLEFLRPATGTTVLVGGRLVETESVATVRFYPDGTCDRFRAQIRTGSATARIFAVDPWTCAPLIGPEGSR